tara:strand:+ start:114 stop:482 length:369 start_codon:yes stop_codon:yes gene_type:complete
MSFKKIAIFLFFIMFLYSGINKIFKFNIKVNTLQSKINLPHIICSIGMILVIILEIAAPLIIYYNTIYPNKLELLTKLSYIALLLFLIVVTFLYHPPTDKLIPFLSNVTTFAGILYLYSDLK